MSDKGEAREELPHVVIIGGGFAGLYCARGLRRAPVRVTMLDRRNHHLFQPLLYQVATAALNPSDIAMPIRSIFRRQRNVTVLLAEATGIDTAGKKVLLADGELAYDLLVVAAGAAHSYFGHDEWAQFAPGLKSIEDALDIRRRVLIAFERAEREPDAAARREELTFVIVGAGPTGVELAGALSEISRHTLERDFRHIDPTEARVILIEGLDRVLPAMSVEASTKARRQLEKLGVEVRASTRVTGIDGHGVSLGEERIPARTVLWAAGVAAAPIARSLGAPLDRAGRVKVLPDLTVPYHDDVFVIGDLASIEQDGKPVPGVAPAAIQQGKQTAANLRRRVRGQALRPFHYRDKGTLATIGRARAVAELAGMKIGGFIAWLLWLFVHIFYLIGFRNRVLVLMQWGWAYLTHRRGARLITGMQPPQLPPGPRDLP
jgi:NADH:ubiquinone reductase (H+-translocating)